MIFEPLLLHLCNSEAPLLNKMATTSYAARDLGLGSAGLGDQLKAETEEEIAARKKKMMAAAQPMGANSAATALLGSYGASGSL